MNDEEERAFLKEVKRRVAVGRPIHWQVAEVLLQLLEQARKENVGRQWERDRDEDSEA